MQVELREILSKPFLVIQVGDYGRGYEGNPLPTKLAAVAAKRELLGQPSYPKNPNLPAPYYCVPTDIDGIIMNKIDELTLNGVAYWAQNHSTSVRPRGGCVNADPSELVVFSLDAKPFWAVLVTQKTTTRPKGSTPGRTFERWTTKDYVAESPTYQIDLDIVYTERGKPTLVFERLEFTSGEVLDLNQFHVYWTAEGERLCPQQYWGKRLPCRFDNLGHCCSLVTPGMPEKTDIKPVQSAIRRIVAVAAIHPHVCGRVL